MRNEGIGSISRRSAGLIRRRSMLRRGDTSTPHHRGPASHEPAGAMRHHQVRTREFGPPRCASFDPTQPEPKEHLT
ncbi:hypothetical protein I553_9531 [Mycobacterium xenopi 4042]|uniref:Uncharacterized protein n=1 Tax=Mycobacterium xenopi 4042 TaxID=1299334 RepID=X8E0N3_MYCXE|nr:hypothetical protein I553_9531 [Mycobacterium xenopi 4042]